MNVELDAVEKTLLVEILQNRLAEMRQEVHHARVSDFKEDLKSKEETLRGVLEKLAAT